MAYYQNANSLTQLSDPVFERTFGSDDAVPVPGIYKCTACEREIAVDKAFPSHDPHPHSERGIKVSWKLIVRAR